MLYDRIPLAATYTAGNWIDRCQEPNLVEEALDRGQNVWIWPMASVIHSQLVQLQVRISQFQLTLLTAQYNVILSVHRGSLLCCFGSTVDSRIIYKLITGTFKPPHSWPVGEVREGGQDLIHRPHTYVSFHQLLSSWSTACSVLKQLTYARTTYH